MSDMRDMLIEAASRRFTDLATREHFEEAENGALPAGVWPSLEQAGFTRATLSEKRGGDGTDLGDAVSIVREAGRHAIAAPLAETLIAELALAAAGLAPRKGILTVGPVLEGERLTLAKKGAQWLLSGTVHGIPWGRNADALVLLARSGAQWHTVVVEGAKPSAEDRSLANEPRETYVFKRRALAASSVGKAGKGFDQDRLMLHGALFRSAAMAGALGRVLELSVQYAKDRVQFGRPIGQFQAVQQQLAVLASQSAVANAAIDAVLEALGRGPATFEIAATKARIGEAVHVGSGIAHAVHAAMGFTQEHSLHRSTRRLWSWRDEFGTEADWAVKVGEAALRVGGENIWAFLCDGKAPGAAAGRGAPKPGAGRTAPRAAARRAAPRAAARRAAARSR